MIKGTSNQTILTIAKFVKQASYEVGTDIPGGGAGQPNVGSNEYREIDNATPGTVFVPGDHHLPWGIPQVRTTV